MRHQSGRLRHAMFSLSAVSAPALALTLALPAGGGQAAPLPQAAASGSGWFAPAKSATPKAWRKRGHVRRMRRRKRARRHGVGRHGVGGNGLPAYLPPRTLPLRNPHRLFVLAPEEEDAPGVWPGVWHERPMPKVVDWGDPGHALRLARARAIKRYHQRLARVRAAAAKLSDGPTRRPAVATALVRETTGIGAQLLVPRASRPLRTGKRRLLQKLAALKPRGLPLHLAVAVVTVESNWRPHVRGLSGEFGLMQVMPGTARQFAPRSLRRLDPKSFAKLMMMPEINIRIGTKVLYYCYRRAGGDIAATIGCYNRGPGRMWQWSGNAITRRYVHKVRRLISRSRKRAAGRQNSQVLSQNTRQ